MAKTGKKKARPEWRYLCSDGDEETFGATTSRMVVPGGWVYRTIVMHPAAEEIPGGAPMAVSTTFVPRRAE